MYSVIKRPFLTIGNRFLCEVDKRATKEQIKKAAKRLLRGISDVISVKTIRVRRKTHFVGRTRRLKPSLKVAVVKVKPRI